MCMMVYLGCDRPPRAIAWDANAPAFHVAELTPGRSDASVRGQFSKAHVVYVGAHEGCGCGFSFNQYPQEDPEEVAAARTSAGRLAEYLESMLAQEPELEIYACWDGDQSLPRAQCRELHPEQLRAEAFWFEEKTLYRVTRASASLIERSRPWPSTASD